MHLGDILLDILIKDPTFTTIFGDKQKMDANADYNIVLIPSEGYKEYLEQLDTLEHEELVDPKAVEGFLMYDLVGGEKEYIGFALRNFKGFGSAAAFSTIKGHKLHVLANSPIVEAFIEIGIKIDRVYDNYLGEAIVVLDFS
jgi:hypothetical protein